MYQPITTSSKLECGASPQATYADLAVAVLLDTLSKYKPEILAAFPALKKLKSRVESLPNIAKWIAKRPESTH